MPNDATLGEKLSELRRRADLTLEQIAADGGYKGRSSVQRFFDPAYNPDYLPMLAAQKLARAFVGKGNPPIGVQEVLTLAGVPVDKASREFSIPDELVHPGSLPRDIPIYGTALGCEAKFDGVDGAGSLSVEQAALDQSEILGYLRRPPALNGRKDVYGVYISGASMFPRFHDGESVIVDPKRPPMIGDDVIVHLCEPDEHEGDRVTAVLIKRLVRRTSTYIELAQFNPAISFRVDASQVKSVHRIIPATELLS